MPNKIYSNFFFITKIVVNNIKYIKETMMVMEWSNVKSIKRLQITISPKSCYYKQLDYYFNSIIFVIIFNNLTIYKIKKRTKMC